jgi:hypothetical protein
MVATATRTILENLDRIPNEDQRTKVSIIAFDTSLYFFSIPVCNLIRHRSSNTNALGLAWEHANLHDGGFGH